MIPAEAQARIVAGEHGVSMEKNEPMSETFSANSIAAIRGFKNLFDPDGFFNPGKLLPTGRGCVESRGTVRHAD